MIVVLVALLLFVGYYVKKEKELDTKYINDDFVRGLMILLMPLCMFFSVLLYYDVDDDREVDIMELNVFCLCVCVFVYVYYFMLMLFAY